MEYIDKRKLTIAGVSAVVLFALLIGIASGEKFDFIAATYAAEDSSQTYTSWEANSNITPTFEGLQLSVQGSLQKSSDSFGSNVAQEEIRLEEVRAEEERIAQEEAERLAEEERQRERDSVQAQYFDVSGGVAGRFTLYGMDCYGCSGQYSGRGGTALGITMDRELGVLQSNGTWAPGVTYNGYYIIAAGPQYPLGTIVQISNHGFAGAGLTPGVPFLAIVADRGSAVYGNKFDLYAGSERNLQIYQNPGYGTVTVVY